MYEIQKLDFRVKYHNLETSVMPRYEQSSTGCVYEAELGQLFFNFHRQSFEL